MWSSVPETVPIGVATPASKHIGVVGASLRGLFPLLMMSASGTSRRFAVVQQLRRLRSKADIDAGGAGRTIRFMSTRASVRTAADCEPGDSRFSPPSSTRAALEDFRTHLERDGR
jgi:hypothetical protein